MGPDSFDEVVRDFRREEESARKERQRQRDERHEASRKEMAERAARRQREHALEAFHVGMFAFGVVLTVIGLGFVTTWAFQASPLLGSVMAALDFGLVFGALYYIVEV